MPSRATILLEVGQPIPSRGSTKPRHAIKPSKIRDVPAPQVNVLMQVNVLNCHTSDITSVWPHRSPSPPAFHTPSNHPRAARTAAARASFAKAHVEKSLRLFSSGNANCAAVCSHRHHHHCATKHILCA